MGSLFKTHYSLISKPDTYNIDKNLWIYVLTLIFMNVIYVLMNPIYVSFTIVYLLLHKYLIMCNDISEVSRFFTVKLVLINILYRDHTFI